MKTIIILSATILLLPACTQTAYEAGVPKKTIETFNENFNGANVKSWDKEKDGGFEAEFDYNGEETSATFSPDGILMETEVEIDESALPSSIDEYLKINYAGKSIDEVTKIITGEGIVKYEVEIEKVDLIFDAKGNVSK